MNQKLSINTINKIKQRLTIKPRIKFWFQLKSLIYFVAVIMCVCVAFLSIQWLINQAMVFNVFWPYISNSWVGWLWVLIPEFVIIALLFIFLVYIIYKRTDWFGVAWADVISAGLVILIIFTSLAINTDAITSATPIKSIHQAFLTQPYRIWLRDQHIIDLEQKQEYYGILTKINDSMISIDHGGVVLDFKDDNTQNISVGQRIWVKFDHRNDVRIIINQKTW